MGALWIYKVYMYGMTHYIEGMHMCHIIDLHHINVVIKICLIFENHSF